QLNEERERLREPTEQRRYPRAALSVKVTVGGAPGTRPAYSASLGEGGFSVQLPTALPVGQELPVSLELPGQDTPVSAMAKVAWSYEDGRSGFEFSELPAHGREALQKLVGAPPVE